MNDYKPRAPRQSPPEHPPGEPRHGVQVKTPTEESLLEVAGRNLINFAVLPPQPAEPRTRIRTSLLCRSSDSPSNHTSALHHRKWCLCVCLHVLFS